MLRYVPILKGKPAEFTALGFTKARTRGRCLPLLEVLPPADDSNPQHVETVCQDAITAVAIGWGTSDEIAVDPLFLPSSMALSAGDIPLERLMTEARAQKVQALPVVRVSDPPDVIAAAAAHSRDRRGVVVRLHGDDLQEDVSDIDTWLTDVLKDLAITAGDADLLIDVGAVGDSSTVTFAVRTGRDLLRGISNISTWRTVTLAAGGFPPNLDTIPPHGTNLAAQVRRDGLEQHGRADSAADPRLRRLRRHREPSRGRSVGELAQPSRQQAGADASHAPSAGRRGRNRSPAARRPTVRRERHTWVPDGAWFTRPRSRADVGRVAHTGPPRLFAAV